ncbi:MAG: acetylornithine deacetylase [Gammaproteobacteria bacterium WSBS_2016_MAG_OTU1]
MTHPRLPAAIEWLQQLVAFDTIPARSNKPLIAHVASRLRDEYGIDSMQKEGGEDKTSFFATIGPQNSGGVALSGHTDVVDVIGQDWTKQPFALTEQDDKLYARGSCDMKGFVACALAMAPIFTAAPLQKPIHYAFSRDEEIACAGSEDMIALIKESGLTPESIIVGEPTRMKTISGHKTGLTMRTIFHGFAAHSSMPSAGVSTIPYAAKFIGHLRELELAMAATANSSSPFVPPHGTINVGTIHGGTALNIFAAECTMDWHYRGMPDDDMDKFAADINGFLQEVLLPEMQASGHPASIENIRVSSYPGLIAQPSSALELIETLTGDASQQVVSFGTEAGHFQRAGMSSAVIGPGDINQAHKPDEYIEIAQLDKCLHFMDKLCKHLSA